MPQTTQDTVLRCADPECGEEFIPRRPRQKYHSSRCRKRHWERRYGHGGQSVLTCPHCGGRVSAALQKRKRKKRPRRRTPRLCLVVLA